MSRGTRTASEAAPARASRQATAKLLWPRARRRKCGGCAVKDRVLTWGDLALWLFCEAAAKPKADRIGSEKSAEIVVAEVGHKP